jgi:hypothetical protein
MKNKVWQDKHSWTHIDWELDDVTPRMLNWFWCNMEKCDHLWHPDQHHGFEWLKGHSVSELKSPILSIHIAPQTWGDGLAMRPYLRMEPLESVPADIRETIKYDHVVIVAGISIFGENVDPKDPPMAWRVHQWQKTDDGVIGMSSGMTAEGCKVESGMVWAAHAIEEVGNWGVFLADLSRLYKVVTRADICPYYSFRVEGTGCNARYISL